MNFCLVTTLYCKEASDANERVAKAMLTICFLGGRLHCVVPRQVSVHLGHEEAPTPDRTHNVKITATTLNTHRKEE
jgi:hypothetical protein